MLFLQVTSAKSNINGWMDATTFGNWLRYVQVSTTPAMGNVRHIISGGQIFYESIKDIESEEELLLIRKPVIDLDTRKGKCFFPSH